MAGVTAQPPAASMSSRSSPATNGNGNANLDYINGHGALPDSPASTAPPSATHSKKGKTANPQRPQDDQKKTEKLLAARINELEQNTKGDKEQEAEIEREVKKATRDLTNLLTGMETPLSRLEAVQNQYKDLLGRMKRLDKENAKNKKRGDNFQKEKETQRSELSKTEENKRIEESEKRSRELQGDKLETVLWVVDEGGDQRANPDAMKLNMEMDEVFRQKFKSFIEQYELRELHFQSLMRTKECEVQYNLARYERERKVAENEQNRSRTLSAQVSTFSQTETELRSQLNIYVEKFKQVEDTLNNSNDLFLTFRKEMEEMSKKTKRLEKENLNLTRKHDLTNRNILEMAEERTRVNKDLETLRKKNSTLESVIRRMQEQGRAPATGSALEGEEEGTDSEYDEDEEYEEGSEDVEYDDDTEEEALQAQVGNLPTFGPVPPPPPASQAQINGKANGDMNGLKSSYAA
ncbi:MAG: hypothetical protein L6R37_002082 [Teloschistes peruensis]|nr:MAG: hypothetical protein L6R37_002082 [Teloschistes peruensis]